MPESALSDLLRWVAEKRKTGMADDLWKRRYFDTQAIKRRTIRKRRVAERMLMKVTEPDILCLPENEKRWYWDDTAF